VVQYSRRLLQAIGRIIEPTHQLRVSGVNEAGGLRAVDHIGECAVEEGDLHIRSRGAGLLTSGPARGVGPSVQRDREPMTGGSG
jgi:hypothetical protein